MTINEEIEEISNNVEHLTFTRKGYKKYLKGTPIYELIKGVDLTVVGTEKSTKKQELTYELTQREKGQKTKYNSRSKGGKIGGKRHYVKKLIKLIASVYLSLIPLKEGECYKQLDYHGNLIQHIQIGERVIDDKKMYIIEDRVVKKDATIYDFIDYKCK